MSNKKLTLEEIQAKQLASGLSPLSHPSLPPSHPNCRSSTIIPRGTVKVEDSKSDPDSILNKLLEAVAQAAEADKVLVRQLIGILDCFGKSLKGQTHSPEERLQISRCFEEANQLLKERGVDIFYLPQPDGEHRSFSRVTYDLKNGKVESLNRILQGGI